jgi:hypothetical protein
MNVSSGSNLALRRQRANRLVGNPLDVLIAPINATIGQLRFAKADIACADSWRSGLGEAASQGGGAVLANLLG